MSGLHILDLMSHDDAFTAPVEGDADLVAQFAESLVANLINTITILRDLRPNMFPSTREPKALALARALRVEFEQWVQDAEALHLEGTRLEAAGHAVARLDELRDFSGLTQAMLQVTLEGHLESVDQISRGEVISMGELRRELQLRRNG